MKGVEVEQLILLVELAFNKGYEKRVYDEGTINGPKISIDEIIALIHKAKIV